MGSNPNGGLLLLGPWALLFSTNTSYTRETTHPTLCGWVLGIGPEAAVSARISGRTLEYRRNYSSSKQVGWYQAEGVWVYRQRLQYLCHLANSDCVKLGRSSGYAPSDGPVSITVQPGTLRRWRRRGSNSCRIETQLPNCNISSVPTKFIQLTSG